MTHLPPIATAGADRDTAAAAAATSSPLPAGPVVVTSTWPWRPSEKRTIALTPVVGLVVGVLGRGWWWTAVAVAVATAFWLYRIGHHRKTRSLVTATITQDRITLTSSTLMGSSTVAIDAVDQLGCRDFQSDRAVLLLGGGTAARVPERLLEQEPVREVLARILSRDPQVSTDARAVLARAGIG